MFGKILSENWKIFIAASILTVIILLINLSWPYIQDEIWGKHPDTYVCIYGMNNSYGVISQNNYKITLNPIVFPTGVSNNIRWIPLEMFHWNYSENSKYYKVYVTNRGDDTARNLKLKLNFHRSNTMKNVEIPHEDRITIIEGGTTGSFIVFLVPELLPGERQIINILTNHENTPTIEVWSETEGDIKNIFVFDMVIEQNNNSKTLNSGTIESTWYDIATILAEKNEYDQLIIRLNEVLEIYPHGRSDILNVYLNSIGAVDQRIEFDQDLIDLNEIIVVNEDNTTEIPSLTYNELIINGKITAVNIVFFSVNESDNYGIFYGNPNAIKPQYRLKENSDTTFVDKPLYLLWYYIEKITEIED